MRQKVPQPSSPDPTKNSDTIAKNSLTTIEAKDQASYVPPCIIVKTTKPPSFARLTKEIAKIEEIVVEAEHLESEARKRKPKEANKNKQSPINPTLNLKDHPINVVLRKSNEFINETFLNSNDKKIDLKKMSKDLKVENSKLVRKNGFSFAYMRLSTKKMVW
jgi:LAS superfamily LD-carboxypeptidase LdcB